MFFYLMEETKQVMLQNFLKSRFVNNNSNFDICGPIMFLYLDLSGLNAALTQEKNGMKNRKKLFIWFFGNSEASG